VPSTDLSETDKEIEITAQLPGLEKKDVQLNVTDNVLMIRGEKKNEREDEGTKHDHSIDILVPTGLSVSTRNSNGRMGLHRCGREMPPQLSVPSIAEP
jgi:Hsp20/alpha crystallin family